MALVLPLSWVHAVSGSCSCNVCKRGKRNAACGLPSRREMMTLFLLARAFPPQLHQSRNRSMGFHLVTALVLFCGLPWARTQTSPSSSRAQATGVWKPSHPQSSALCQEFPVAVFRDSWGRAKRVLGQLSGWRKSKQGKHPCAPQICLELNHKILI